MHRLVPCMVSTKDVDYTFGQVSFVEPKVDYGGNCGNLTSFFGGRSGGKVVTFSKATSLRLWGRTRVLVQLGLCL